MAINPDPRLWWLRDPSTWTQEMKDLNAKAVAGERSASRQHEFQDKYPGCTFGELSSCAAQWEATNTPMGTPLSPDAAKDPEGFQAGVNAGGRIGAGFAGNKAGITYNGKTGYGPGNTVVEGSGQGSETTDKEATNVAQLILEAFPWMKDLMGVWDIILSGVKNDLPDEIILSQIRETDSYKSRFPAMAARESSGFNPINEAEYLEYEDDYRQILRGYGVLGLLAPTERDLQDLFTDWIGGDVSPLELSGRLDRGYAALSDASPNIKDAFQTFYGVQIDDASLLTYFLDEDLGLQEMERVIAASAVGGAALQYGLSITRTRAELLSSEGITGPMAKQGFADVARETPQLQTLARLQGSDPLSQLDLEDFFFHEDPEIAKRRRKIFDTALAEFQGAGASSVTRRGALSELVDFDQSV